MLVEDVGDDSRALFRLDGDTWEALGGPPSSASEKRRRHVVGLTCCGDSLACCCDQGEIYALEDGGWTAIPGPPRFGGQGTTIIRWARLSGVSYAVYANGPE